MSNLHVKYLLIGGGVASSAAAVEIRRRDPDGSALLVGQESTRPYFRTRLSTDYLLGKVHKSELFTLTPDWFATNNIDLRTGRRAVQLDVTRHGVTFDSGEEISFDKLLLATGRSPRHLDVPGAQLPNVFYLRTIEDADRLHHAIEKARHEGRPHDNGRGRVTVVGGTLLALELAATARTLGLETDLVVAEPYPLSPIVGETTGRFLVRHLTRHGVRVHVGRRIDRLDGDGRVQRVSLNDGETLPTDLVIAAIGTFAGMDLLRGTALSAEKGILVDDHCRTSDPDIFAAGDCAALFDPLFGKHRLSDPWDFAESTGQLAGRNMAGADERYAGLTQFETRLFDLPVRGWGYARPVDRRLLRGTPGAESADFAEIGTDAAGRVSEVLAVGAPTDADLLPQLVARRIVVDGNEELLKDPTSDLRTVLA